MALAPAPSGTIWRAGETVEVSWTSAANHGGGYMYRLCPAARRVDETCFQSMPLLFTGKSSLRWGGVGAATALPSVELLPRPHTQFNLVRCFKRKWEKRCQQHRLRESRHALLRRSAAGRSGSTART